MSEFIIMERKVATTSEPIKEQIPPEVNTPVETEAVIADETVYDETAKELLEGEAISETRDEFVGEEGFAEDTVEGNVDDVYIEPIFEEGEYIDSGFIDDGYIDPGFYEGEYMEPGMEMGMGEIKEPLLSSWTFVIGISAAVFVVSIALGALLAKLKIKKGIDLYED